MHIFFDGAFGTYYNQISGRAEPCEKANLSDPETVLQIHREYIAAGAGAIKTNTFGANPAAVPDPGELRDIIGAGLSLACDAANSAGREILVFADIGGMSAERDPHPDYYLAVANLFLACGDSARNFLFETLDELDPIAPAIHEVRRARPEGLIAVSFTVSQEGYTRTGRHYRDLLLAAKRLPVDIVGLNCTCGPAHMRNLIRRLSARDLEGVLFSAMPNAGYPNRVGGRLEYRDNPDYFADMLNEISALGVQVVGGCCGTTPQHIKLGIELIQNRTEPGTQRTAQSGEQDGASVPRRENRLETALSAGERVILAELAPPVGPDGTRFIRNARMLAESGVTAVSVPDSPLGRARADSMLMAAKLLRETGVEAVPHLACRDRNSIAIKSALLAGSMENIRNVLVITGDPVPQQEDHPEDRTGAKGVFNFHAGRLIPFIRNLNESLFTDAPYQIAAAIDVGATNFDAELSRAEQKLKSGAAILLTQAIFNEKGLRNLERARAWLDGYILAGIMPVAGYRNALFLNYEVPGIEIPQKLLDRLKDAEREQSDKLSLEYSRGLIDRAWPHCDGFYLMTPLQRVELTIALISYIQGREADDNRR